MFPFKCCFLRPQDTLNILIFHIFYYPTSTNYRRLSEQ
ncbi:conserved hypothetical protein [delta proteobacterium NaphS2]|nr:conserved hypothetical protein [delta proteobacterium NaphS2]